MPHVSRVPLEKTTKSEIEEKVFSLLVDTHFRVRHQVFNELLTKTERIMFAKRLALIFLLTRGTPPYAISKTLKVSSSTVLRFSLLLERGVFAETVRWLDPPGIGNKILGTLAELAAIPFDAQRLSISQILAKREGRYRKRKK